MALSECFEVLDSILVDLLITKKSSEMILREILELAQVIEGMSGLIGKDEFNEVQINDTVIKAVQAKRKGN